MSLLILSRTLRLVAALGLICRRLIPVVLALVLCRCGDVPPNYQYLEVDIEPELVGGVDHFLREMRQRGVYPIPGVRLPRIVHWRTLAGDTAGVCVTPTPRVYIALGMRGRMVPGYILVTLYHELSHCMYGLMHEEESGHILSPFIPPDAGYWDSVRMGLELDHLAVRIREESTAYQRWLVLRQQARAADDEW